MEYTLRFCSALAAVCCLLIVSGCEQIGDKNLYEIEQKSYAAQKLERKVLGIKPELATDSDLERVASKYGEVVEKFKNSYPNLNNADTLQAMDSLTQNQARAANLASEAQIQKARLYELMGDTARTIEALDGFEEQFPFNRDHVALALLQLGAIYEAVGNLDKVETAWNKVLQLYYPPANRELEPNTDILELPVKLAKMYDEMEDVERREYYLDRAEMYYNRIIEDFKYSPLGLTTIRFLADTYVMRGRPEEAIDLLDEVRDSTGTVVGAARVLKADIFINNLGDTASARKLYEEIISAEADSMHHPKALMQLARLELMHGNYERGREYLTTIKDKYPNRGSLLARTQQLYARSFDRQGDFNRAFGEYKWLTTQYPQSVEAVETYRYLPGFLRSHDQDEIAEEWEENAIEFLSETKSDREGTIVGLSAHSNLVNMLVDSEQWNSAAEELIRLQATYPRSIAGTSALVKAGNIYLDKLNNKERAKELYETQIETYPEIKITETAREKLRVEF